MSIALYTDHSRMIIPNWLSLGGTIIGVTVHALMDGWSGVGFSLIGMLGLLLLLLIVYAAKGVEAGDVKLFAGLGALAGLEVGFTSFLYSIFAAAVVGLLIFFWKVRRRGTSDHYVSLKRMQFPFMYAVVPGFVLTFLSMEVLP